MSGSGHAPGRKHPWQQVACFARVTIATQGFTEEKISPCLAQPCSSLTADSDADTSTLTDQDKGQG